MDYTSRYYQVLHCCTEEQVRAHVRTYSSTTTLVRAFWRAQHSGSRHVNSNDFGITIIISCDGFPLVRFFTNNVLAAPVPFGVHACLGPRELPAGRGCFAFMIRHHTSYMDLSNKICHRSTNHD